MRLSTDEINDALPKSRLNKSLRKKLKAKAKKSKSTEEEKKADQLVGDNKSEVLLNTDKDSNIREVNVLSTLQDQESSAAKVEKVESKNISDVIAQNLESVSLAPINQHNSTSEEFIGDQIFIRKIGPELDSKKKQSKILMEEISNHSISYNLDKNSADGDPLSEISKVTKKSKQLQSSRKIKLNNKKSPISKPARSLRSTVKITYKQSNIFALQIEDKVTVPNVKSKLTKSESPTDETPDEVVEICGKIKQKDADEYSITQELSKISDQSVNEPVGQEKIKNHVKKVTQKKPKANIQNGRTMPKEVQESYDEIMINSKCTSSIEKDSSIGENEESYVEELASSIDDTQNFKISNIGKNYEEVKVNAAAIISEVDINKHCHLEDSHQKENVKENGEQLNTRNCEIATDLLSMEYEDLDNMSLSKLKTYKATSDHLKTPAEEDSLREITSEYKNSYQNKEKAKKLKKGNKNKLKDLNLELEQNSGTTNNSTTLKKISEAENSIVSITETDENKLNKRKSASSEYSESYQTVINFNNINVVNDLIVGLKENDTILSTNALGSQKEILELQEDISSITPMKVKGKKGRKYSESLVSDSDQNLHLNGSKIYPFQAKTYAREKDLITEHEIKPLENVELNNENDTTNKKCSVKKKSLKEQKMNDENGTSELLLADENPENKIVLIDTGTPVKTKDAFEFEDDLVPIQEISPKFKRKSYPATNSCNLANTNENIETEVIKKKTSNKLRNKQIIPLIDLEKQKPLTKNNSSNSKSEDISSPVRRQRSAKSKALENINIMEKQLDQSLDIELTESEHSNDEEIKEPISSKKKNIKQKDVIEDTLDISDNALNKSKSNEKPDNMDNFSLTRKCRTAKAKALQSIKILEKSQEDVIHDELIDKNCDDLKSHDYSTDVELASEEKNRSTSDESFKEENKTPNNDSHIHNDSSQVTIINEKVDQLGSNKAGIISSSLDTLDIGQNLTQEIDKKKRRLKKSKDCTSDYSTCDMQAMIPPAKSNSTCEMLKDDLNIEVNESSCAVNDGEKIYSYPNDPIENANESTDEVVNSVEDVGYTRRSRVAKSKALENITDLKEKTNKADWSTIEDKKNLTKTIKKSKHLKTEADIFDVEVYVDTCKKIGSSGLKHRKREKFSELVDTKEMEMKGVNHSDYNKKSIDCYDIDQVDEDFNTDAKTLIPFSLNKAKKSNKSKNSQIHEVFDRDNLSNKFSQSFKDQVSKVDSSKTLLPFFNEPDKQNNSLKGDDTTPEINLETESTQSLNNTLEATVVEISSILEKSSQEAAKLPDNETDEISIEEIRRGIASTKPENKSGLSKVEVDVLVDSSSKKRNGEDFFEDGRSRSDKALKFDDEFTESEHKRRSRRACKVNTYNENDLAEAIFLQVASEKEKDQLKKKKDENCIAKNKNSTNQETIAKEKQLNSDELFDLLKATATENFNIPKPLEEPFPDGFSNLSNDFTDDNFDEVFDDILKKSQALFAEKSQTDRSKGPTTDIFPSKTNDSYSNPVDYEQNDSSKQSSSNSNDLYCDICKKSFKRIDNLIKHKTTLTHISKLSEIEAKKTEDKLEPLEDETEDSSKSKLADYARKRTESDSLYSYPPTPGTDSLKIAEIITEAFQKPPLDSEMRFSEISPVSEYRRYKSLGERKSFESDQEGSNISSNLDSNPYAPHISKNAGVILEKQISLLQNIIENRGLDYIDDISMSSYRSLDNTNNQDSPMSVSSSKIENSSNIEHSQNKLNAPVVLDKPTSFLKPLQLDDISEDGINKNGEDVKARKVLNRDEELFLECCSLLKSSSEVSNFSKKSKTASALNNFELKMSDEPDLFESKNLTDKVVEDSSDYSRIPTPIGDSFGDTSNSNTISSNWKMDNENGAEDKEETYFNFRKDGNQKETNEEHSTNSSKFKNFVSKAIKIPFKSVSKIIKSRKQQSHEMDIQDEDKNLSYDCSSKMPTKGALKVFEGLKVSIPTEELNLEAVLNNSPPIKKIEGLTYEDLPSEKGFLSPKTPRSARKSKPVKNKQPFDDRFIFKVKKKPTHKENENSPNSESALDTDDKILDVYDFEETQDNTEVFAKPDYKTFRTKGVENLKIENIFEHIEGQTLSSSSSSTTSVNKKSDKTNECITKKKHMIMGRIFKNALKPKVDEDIKDIPLMDQNELVESYVLSCNSQSDDAFQKPKMTEEEMNYLFDKLLDKPPDTTKKLNQIRPDSKNSSIKKKLKLKYKKRQRSNSDSTDDEFGLNKMVKKRPNRKNAKEEDNSINLEQELKECIGVASRKSQRKCTSGKQNVLVEYWSSDESAFEAFLENHLQELSEKSELPSFKVEESFIKREKAKKGEPSSKMVKECETEKRPKIKQKSSNISKKKGVVKDGTAPSDVSEPTAANRRKRTAAHPLYHWSSSSEDEMQDLIEVKSIRDDPEDEYDEDRPIQHGWIVGDSPKKLVTMLAQAKGKKTEPESTVKEQGKKKNSNS